MGKVSSCRSWRGSGVDQPSSRCFPISLCVPLSFLLFGLYLDISLETVLKLSTFGDCSLVLFAKYPTSVPFSSSHPFRQNSPDSRWASILLKSERDGETTRPNNKQKNIFIYLSTVAKLLDRNPIEMLLDITTISATWNLRDCIKDIYSVFSFIFLRLALLGWI